MITGDEISELVIEARTVKDIKEAEALIVRSIKETSSERLIDELQSYKQILVLKLSAIEGG